MQPVQTSLKSWILAPNLFQQKGILPLPAVSTDSGGNAHVLISSGIDGFVWPYSLGGSINRNIILLTSERRHPEPYAHIYSPGMLQMDGIYISQVGNGDLSLQRGGIDVEDGKYYSADDATWGWGGASFQIGAEKISGVPFDILNTSPKATLSFPSLGGCIPIQLMHGYVLKLGTSPKAVGPSDIVGVMKGILDRGELEIAYDGENFRTRVCDSASVLLDGSPLVSESRVLESGMNIIFGNVAALFTIFGSSKNRIIPSFTSEPLAIKNGELPIEDLVFSVGPDSMIVVTREKGFIRGASLLMIPDDHISCLHAIISFGKGGEVFIQDNASRYGTRIIRDERMINVSGPELIYKGDHLVFGRSKVSVGNRDEAGVVFHAPRETFGLR